MKKKQPPVKVRTVITIDLLPVSSWPGPDAAGLPPEKQETFARRKLAVTLYAEKVAIQKITELTGYSETEINRIVKRCLTPTGAGTIAGFYGCVPHLHVADYTRRKSLEFVPEHQIGGRSGALHALLGRFPQVEENLKARFLKRPAAGNMAHARISIMELSTAFLQDLRACGVSDHEWPFNTLNKGYETIRRYCKELTTEYADEYLDARHSEKTAHKRKTGRGHRPMIQALRPSIFMELDYNLVDAACIIVVKNRFGVELELNLPRWYFGLIVDPFDRLVLGVYIAYEQNPSAHAMLATVQSAVFPAIYDLDDPRSNYLVDASILSDDLIPNIRHQTFCVIKLDNAWANASMDAVNQLMDLTGCAVNFGPPGEWSRRPVVENIFGVLAARGLKQLPSTYGANVMDPTRRNPEKQAKALRIHASDIAEIIITEVRKHNQFVSSGSEYSSPIEILQRAVENPDSGYISQQLSVPAVTHSKFQYERFEEKVKAYPKSNIVPYVEVDGSTYTNPLLCRRFDLVGKTLLVFINRFEIRDAYAVVMGTGEPIGQLVIENKWSYYPVTIRHRKRIIKGGKGKQHKDRADPVRAWRDETVQALAERKAPKIANVVSAALNRSVTDERTISKGDVLALHSDQIPEMYDIPAAPPQLISAPEKTAKAVNPRRSAFGLDQPLVPIRKK